jgi:hypothetical protein
LATLVVLGACESRRISPFLPDFVGVDGHANVRLEEDGIVIRPTLSGAMRGCHKSLDTVPIRIEAEGARTRHGVSGVTEDSGDLKAPHDRSMAFLQSGVFANRGHLFQDHRFRGYVRRRKYRSNGGALRLKVLNPDVESISLVVHVC